MYSLLAVTVSLCPQRVDETVQQMLREKHADRMLRMQRGCVVNVRCASVFFSRICAVMSRRFRKRSRELAPSSLRHLFLISMKKTP